MTPANNLPCFQDRLIREFNGLPLPFDILIDHERGPAWRQARREAQAICGRCPNAAPCLTENLRAGEQWAYAVLGANTQKCCDITDCTRPHAANGLCASHSTSARRALKKAEAEDAA